MATSDEIEISKPEEPQIVDSKESIQLERGSSQFFCKKAKDNWKPGLQVALVSVPLSIALGIVQGGEPTQGLCTAAVVCIVQGFIGSSKQAVYGPAGAIVNTVAPLTAIYGYKVLPICALFSSLWIFAINLLKLESYLFFVPKNVLQGFSCSIAIIIGFSQMNFMFGLQNLEKHDMFYLNVAESFQNLGQTHTSTIITFFVFFMPLYALSSMKPKIPWIAIFSVVGILFGFICKATEVSWGPLLLMDQYDDMQGGIFRFDHLYPSYTGTLSKRKIFAASLACGFIQILETFICCSLAETQTKVPFRRDQEIFCLGIANLICGLVGALPGQGVIVRTTLNLNNFATSTMSTFICGLVVLIISLSLMSVFQHIPLPLIAAILVNTAIGMVPVAEIKILFKKSWEKLIILFIVFIICLFMDGASGLIAGMIMSILRNATKVSDDSIVLYKCVGSLHRPQNEANIQKQEGQMVQQTPLTGVTLESGKDVKNDGLLEEIPLQPNDPNQAVFKRKNNADQSKISAFATRTTFQMKPMELQDVREKLFQAVCKDSIEYPQKDEELDETEKILINITGQLTYLNGETIVKRVYYIADVYNKSVVISLQDVLQIDLDGIGSLKTLLTGLDKRKPPIKYLLVEPYGLVASQILNRIEWYTEKKSNNEVYLDKQDALDNLDFR